MYFVNKIISVPLISAFLMGLPHSTMSMESTTTKQRSESFNQAKNYFERITVRHDESASHAQTNTHTSQTSTNKSSSNKDQDSRGNTHVRSRSKSQPPVLVPKSQSSALVPQLNHKLVSDILEANKTRSFQLDNIRTQEAPEYVAGPNGTQICHRLSDESKKRISKALTENPNSYAAFEGDVVGMDSKANTSYAYYNLHNADGSKIDGAKFMVTIIQKGNN
jgi:hypothetical protein